MLKLALFNAAAMPDRPAVEKLLPGFIERTQQGGDGQRGRGFLAACETQGECCLPWKFSHQRHIAGAGTRILPFHPAVPGEILPAIAGADISRAAAAPGIMLAGIHCGQGQRKRALFRP